METKKPQQPEELQVITIALPLPYFPEGYMGWIDPHSNDIVIILTEDEITNEIVIDDTVTIPLQPKCLLHKRANVYPSNLGRHIQIKRIGTQLKLKFPDSIDDLMNLRFLVSRDNINMDDYYLINGVVWMWPAVSVDEAMEAEAEMNSLEEEAENLQEKIHGYLKQKRFKSVEENAYKTLEKLGKICTDYYYQSYDDVEELRGFLENQQKELEEEKEEYPCLRTNFAIAYYNTLIEGTTRAIQRIVAEERFAKMAKKESEALIKSIEKPLDQMTPEELIDAETAATEREDYDGAILFRDEINRRLALQGSASSNESDSTQQQTN
jgi:hypothetical protein